MMMLSQHYSRYGFHRLRSAVAWLFYLESTYYHPSPIIKFGLSKQSHFYSETISERTTKGLPRSLTTLTVKDEAYHDEEKANEYKGKEPTFIQFADQLLKKEDYKNTIKRHLKCSDSTAEAVQAHNFFKLPLETLVERISTFKKLGIEVDDFEKNPSTLFENYETSYELLTTACKTLNIDAYSVFPMLRVHKTLKSYLKLVQYESVILKPFKNRIKYLSNKLEVSERAISLSVWRHTYLLTLSPSRIRFMMDALLDAGVDKRDIFNDLWVFQFNTELAENRLRQALQAGIKDMKPWIVRCSESTFKRSIETRTENMVYKGNSQEEKLAQLFDCSLEEIDIMLKNDPRILNRNLPSMHACREILKAEGFSTQEMLRNPRIFLQIGPATLKQRLNTMHKVGLTPKDILGCLSGLTMKHCKYDNYVKNLTKRLQKTDNDR